MGRAVCDGSSEGEHRWALWDPKRGEGWQAGRWRWGYWNTGRCGDEEKEKVFHCVRRFRGAVGGQQGWGGVAVKFPLLSQVVRPID